KTRVWKDIGEPSFVWPHIKGPDPGTKAGILPENRLYPRGMDAPGFIARLPPSMGIRAPVIQLDASEASKMASPLMSSGTPRRPRGRPLRKRARKAGSSVMRLSRLG